jgi:hypothetical protein
MTASDQATTANLEVEFRDFVQRDFSAERRRRDDSDVEAGVTNANSLFARLTNESMEEIERIIGQLQAMRDLLRDEGDRVQREIMSYADKSRGRIEFLQRIAEDLAQSRSSGQDHIQHDAS